MSSLQIAGRISKIYGLDGELIVNLFNEFPETIDTKQPLFVKIDKLSVPLFIESFTRRGRSGALVRFADIDNQIRATELLGLEFFIRSTESGEDEDDGQLYFENMIGYKAIFDKKTRGEITDFIDSDLNPLFEITIGGKEVLIPAVDEFIKKISQRKGEITFNLPEGLLDLNS